MRRHLGPLAGYVLITIVMTWPVARGLSRDVPADLGDSVLNLWILSWDGEQIRRVLSGHVSAIPQFFDGNIFYPATLTLAYSEHLIAQAIQIFPIYAVTQNPILGYNLLFLSTFLLSGFGTYLLVTDLTGSRAGGFVAGLLYGFALYRVPQSSHLQIVSSQWMPFTLFGLRRYFDTRRRRALAGASAALVAQNLSCGYFLLYFPPFVLAYVLWEIGRRRMWSDLRIWRQFSIAGAVVGLLTVPFLLPYGQLRSQLQFSRSVGEVSFYSADVYSYATASPLHRAWGRIAVAFPKAEGELFPGVVPVLLALIGIVSGIVESRRARTEAGSVRRPAPAWIALMLSIAAAAHFAGLAAVAVARRITFDVGPLTVRMTDANTLLLRGTILLALLLLVSPSARTRIGAFMRSHGFFVLALIAAIWLSLGPVPRVLGRPLTLAAPYAWLFEHVPGFDGLRVPARFAMIALLMLAIVGGYGAAALARLRLGRILLPPMSIAFLVEAACLPFPVNAMTPPAGFNAPAARLLPPRRAPAVYNEVARQPGSVILAELPLGLPDFDSRAMYYSTVHWRPIANGYSGFFPPHYGRLAAALSEIPRHPQISRQALRDIGVTHVIVHEAAYLGSEGVDTSAALMRLGAIELFRDGTDTFMKLEP